MHRMVDNGRGLEATVTLEDPDTYYQPWTGLRRYRRVQQEYIEHKRLASMKSTASCGEATT